MRSTSLGGLLLAAVTAGLLAGCSGSGDAAADGSELNASAMAKKSPRGKGKTDPTTTSGSVTLTWSPPTLNTDGSALSDLAGYRIQYGASNDSLSQFVDVGGASTTSLLVPGLQRGAMYYFAMSALNASGEASGPTNVVSAFAQ